MDQRMQFAADVQRGLLDMTTLCARYGVSRKQLSEWRLRLGSAPADPPRVATGERRTRAHAPDAEGGDDATAWADLARQQRMFNAFRREYNEERTHAAHQRLRRV